MKNAKVVGLLFLALIAVGCKHSRDRLTGGGGTQSPPRQEKLGPLTGTWVGTVTGTNIRTNEGVTLPLTLVLSQQGHAGSGRQWVLGTFTLGSFTAELQSSTGLGQQMSGYAPSGHKATCIGSYSFDVRSDFDVDQIEVIVNGNDCSNVILSHATGKLIRL